MLAPVFDCLNCGEVWRVEIVEEDCSHDDTISVAYCQQCKSVVREKFVEQNGKQVPVWHGLTVEEINEECFSYFDSDGDFEADAGGGE